MVQSFLRIRTITQAPNLSIAELPVDKGNWILFIMDYLLANDDQIRICPQFSFTVSALSQFVKGPHIPSLFT